MKFWLWSTVSLMGHPVSAPVDQITAVLREHGDQCTRANANYLAQQIAAELNLTQEWRTIDAVWTGVKYTNVNERRWVSPWFVVEAKPAQKKS